MTTDQNYAYNYIERMRHRQGKREEEKKGELNPHIPLWEVLITRMIKKGIYMPKTEKSSSNISMLLPRDMEVNTEIFSKKKLKREMNSGNREVLFFIIKPSEQFASNCIHI